MGGSEDVIRAAIEDDRWIGFTAYLPPCIEGVWEEGAIEETGRSPQGWLHISTNLRRQPSRGRTEPKKRRSKQAIIEQALDF